MRALPHNHLPVAHLEIHGVHSCIGCGDNGSVLRYGYGTDFPFYEFDLSDVLHSFYILVVLGVRFKDPDTVPENEVEVVKVRSIEEGRGFVVVERVVLREIIDPDGPFVVIREPENLVDGEVFFEYIEPSVDTEGEDGMVFHVRRFKHLRLGSESVHSGFVLVELFSVLGEHIEVGVEELDRFSLFPSFLSLDIDITEFSFVETKESSGLGEYINRLVRTGVR